MKATTTIITHIRSITKALVALPLEKPNISSASGDEQVSIWAGQASKLSTNGRLQAVIS